MTNEHNTHQQANEQASAGAIQRSVEDGMKSHDAAIGLMDAYRAFIKHSAGIAPERVLSNTMLNQVIRICQNVKAARQCA